MPAPGPDHTDHEPDVAPTEPPPTARATGPSDLIGLRLTLYLGIGIMAVLLAFFFVGPVVGIVVLLVAVALGIMGLVAAIRRAEVRD